MLKRIITMALTAGLLLFTFAGCGEAPAEVGTDKQEPDDTTVSTTDTDNETQDTASGDTTLTVIGNASVKIKGKDGTVILIDPAQFSPSAYDEPADFVLVTHGHDDHKPCNQVQLKDTGTTITWKEALAGGREYRTFRYDNLTIEAVPMGGNFNHAIGSGVGYIITIDGITIYHAGDSSDCPELQALSSYDIDYAMYPIDGVYNMGAEEATGLANIIGATNNIPIHVSNVNPNIDKRDKFIPDGRLIVDDQEAIVLEAN